MSQNAANMSKIPIPDDKLKLNNCSITFRPSIKEKIDNFEDTIKKVPVRTKILGKKKPTGVKRLTTKKEDSKDPMTAFLEKLERKMDKIVTSNERIEDKVNDLEEKMDEKMKKVEKKTEENDENISAIAIELNEINEKNDTFEQELTSIRKELKEKDRKINDLENKLKHANAGISEEEMQGMINSNIERILNERETRRTNSTPAEPSIPQEAIAIPMGEQSQDETVAKSRTSYSDTTKSRMERRTKNPNQRVQPSARNIREEFEDQKNGIQSIMRDARGRVGIFPILSKDIRYFGTITSIENMESIEDNMLFFSPRYSKARIEAAADFCTFDLNIPAFRVNIKDANMCQDPSKKILWVETDPDFAKTMFIAMSKTNNHDINVIQYIACSALDRKKGIDKKMRELRLTDPDLRYQVRIGEADLELWTKHQIPGRFSQYKPMKFATVDPLNELPKLKFKGKEIDPEHVKTITEAVEKLKETENVNHTDKEFTEDENGAFIPVSELRRNKRKGRTPEQVQRAKLRKSATNKEICKNLRKSSSETSENDDSDSVSSDNETVIIGSLIQTNSSQQKPGPSGLSNEEKAALNKQQAEAKQSGEQTAAKICRQDLPPEKSAASSNPIQDLPPKEAMTLL